MAAEAAPVPELGFGQQLVAAVKAGGEEALKQWVGTKVWFEVGGGEYRGGGIKAVDAAAKRIVLIDDEDKKEHRIAEDRVYPRNPPMLEGTEDLTSLSYLHEPGVLHNLKFRYVNSMIYTFSGPILIAINPYKRLPIYTADLLASYASDRHALTKKRTPHVYAIGDQAYRAMRTFNSNQSILVTGESGAGKTETTKILLQYFATKGKKKKKDGPKDGQQGIEQKVLGSTPILESFGNAKTLRNDNSSRFGKFIVVEFDESGTINGAQLKTYLLEKSRLTFQATGERNYHIFYQLVKVVAKEPTLFPSAPKWNLLGVKDYYYLNTNKTGQGLEINEDELENFHATKSALEVIGVDLATFDALATILVALLDLGNVKFKNNEKDEAEVVQEGERDWLGEAALHLGISRESLLTAVTRKTIVAGKETYKVPNSAEQADTARDSLATFIYERLFTWIVERINDSIKAESKAANFIGILDIYGFESFKVNSFEQFCINYANEKLQQQFNQHMFKVEQEEYSKEGINWAYIEFSDNRGCISLIESNMGIIDLLNEEARLPKATPETFVRKLSQKHARQPYYDHPPGTKDHIFGVRHYPGKVEYDATYFIDKNRNVSPADFLAFVSAECTNAFLKGLCDGYEAMRAQQASSKKETVAAQFKDSLTDLMNTIEATEPNYIRCIKPNDEKLPLTFWPGRILDQLKCGGVIEAIRIARAGYPTRAIYKAFCQRYRVLVKLELQNQITAALESEDTVKEATRLILENIEALPELPSKVQYGHTKVFLKAGMLARMEELRTDILGKAATALQRSIRRYNEQSWFEQQRHATLLAQRLWRMKQAMRLAQFMRVTDAVTVFQKHIRRFNSALIYNAMEIQHNAVVTLQKYVRSRLAQDECATRRRIVALQTRIRTWNQQSEYESLRFAITQAQHRWRARAPRAELKRLRMEARQLNNVLEKTKGLEERVLALQSQLEAKTREVAEWREKYEQARVSEESWRQKCELAQAEAANRAATAVEKSPEEIAAEQAREREASERMQREIQRSVELETQVQELRAQVDATTKELAQAKEEAAHFREKLEKFQEKMVIEKKMGEKSAEEKVEKLALDRVAALRAEDEARVAARLEALEADFRTRLAAEIEKVRAEEAQKYAALVSARGAEASKSVTPSDQLAEKFSGFFATPITSPRERRSRYVKPTVVDAPDAAPAAHAPAASDASELKPPSVVEAMQVIRKTTRNSRRPEFLREEKARVEAAQAAAELNEQSNLPSSGSQGNLLAAPASVKAGLPEEMIEKVLKTLAPDDLATQLELLTDSLLKTYLERAANENPSEIVSHTSIPRPAFILARYVSTKAGKLEGDHIAAIPKVLDIYVNKAQTLGVLIWFFNVSAVLYRFTSKFTKAPTADAVPVIINWQDRKQRPVNLVNPPPTELVHTLAYQLQIVFVSIYGRLLRRIMRESADILTKLLTNLDYATSSSSAQAIANMLQNHLTLFQQHCMLSSFSQQFFSHVFRFIDATIFNEIIAKKDLCKFAVAMQIKTSVDELIARVKRAGGEMWFGPVNKLFRHTQQLINCLTLEKNMLSVDNVRREVCPDLNLNQIKHICELYVPGEFEDPIPEEVFESIIEDPDFDALDPIELDREHFDLDTRDIHFVDVVDIAGKEFTPDMVVEVLDNLDPKRRAAKAKEATQAAAQKSQGGGIFGIRFASIFGSSKPNA